MKKIIFVITFIFLFVGFSTPVGATSIPYPYTNCGSVALPVLNYQYPCDYDYSGFQTQIFDDYAYQQYLTEHQAYVDQINYQNYLDELNRYNEWLYQQQLQQYYSNYNYNWYGGQGYYDQYDSHYSYYPRNDGGVVDPYYYFDQNYGNDYYPYYSFDGMQNRPYGSTDFNWELYYGANNDIACEIYGQCFDYAWHWN